MQHIIRKLAYQRKYGRYKHLFSIELEAIVDLGIPNFLLLIKKVMEKEGGYKIVNYFHLQNQYFEDYFSGHSDRIFITIKPSLNSQEQISLIEILLQNGINCQFVYVMSFDDFSINNPLFKFLRTKNNIIYHIHSGYLRKDLFWIRKNIWNIPPNEVLLSLDDIKNQDGVNHENIFAIIELFKEWKFPMNIDFIRFESAYRNIYVVGPKELHMDISEWCNTKCSFCVTNGPDFMKRINIDGSDRLENHYKQLYTSNQILSLVNEMQKSGTESLALGITWEPLIHPDIKTILSGLNDIDIQVWFLTNGYCLLENLEFILNNPRTAHFYINISSGNYESFMVTRPGDRFQNFLNVWEAIKIIRSKRPDIIIRCLYVITPKNIGWVQDFINLCVKYNISEIELKRVVLYEFSTYEFRFSEKEIAIIIGIIEYNKKCSIAINHNFDYILDEFNRILKEPQDTEDIELDWRVLKPMTNNCYNPYFYIALFRNGAYWCGKFISKIGKIPGYNLFRTLFIEKHNQTIIESGLNIGKVLWERMHKIKCSRCHHMDVTDMVKEYLKAKQLASDIRL